MRVFSVGFVVWLVVFSMLPVRVVIWVRSSVIRVWTGFVL